MKKLINKALVFLLVTAVNCFSNYAVAQNAATSPNDNETQIRSFVQNIGDKIVRITGDKSLSKIQVENKMINLVDSVIDPEWISRFVLGKYYKTIADEQKLRFKNLYREYMINTYGPKFQHYNVTKFTLLSSEDQNSFYLVRCEFMQKDLNSPVSVNFRVINKNNKPAVIDLVTEGVSLIETQRSEFSSAISQGGIDKFLSDLQQKVNNLRSHSYNNNAIQTKPRKALVHK